MIEFIFMLTHNDATVPNALEVLSEVHDAGPEGAGRDPGPRRRGQPVEDGPGQPHRHAEPSGNELA